MLPCSLARESDFSKYGLPRVLFSTPRGQGGPRSAKDKSLNDTSRIGSVALLAARFLMAAIFMFAGYGKLAAYHQTEIYMQNAGLPDFLLPLVILTELGGGLALILGWQVRIAALLLGGFSILTGLLFHTNFSDPNQTLNFLKNIAMAGGFLALFVSGAGAYSLDMPRRWTAPPAWPPGRRSRTSLTD